MARRKRMVVQVGVWEEETAFEDRFDAPPPDYLLCEEVLVHESWDTVDAGHQLAYEVFGDDLRGTVWAVGPNGEE